MNKNEQISAIKSALTQFELVSDIEQQFAILKTSHFRSKPLPPTLEQIPDPEYPAIKTDTKFLSWKLLPGLIFWPWIIIYFFKYYMKDDEAAQEKIRNSPEYRAQCEKLDEEVREKRVAAEAKYQAELKEYNEKTLAEYQKEYDAWSKKAAAAAAVAEERLLNAKNALSSALACLNDIPEEYKEAPILDYILKLISNTDKTVTEAVNIYRCRHIYTESPEALAQSMRWYSKGNESINRYIDAIVGSLRSTMPSIPHIYGGTNQCKYYRFSDNNALSKPNIIVKYKLEFDLSSYHLERCAYYTNVTAYGQPIEHSCSTSRWVASLTPVLMIFTDTEEENKKIVAEITNAYKDAPVIEINDLENFEEKYQIALGYNSKSDIACFDNGSSYRTCLYFNPIYAVYDVKDYEKSRISCDHILQASLCLQASHLKSILNRSKKYANDIDFIFAKLIDGKAVSNSLISLESMRFRGLKHSYNEGKPLNKADFYEEYHDILCYYPNLWDRTLQRFSADQIKSDIQNQRDLYSNRLEQLYNDLNTPQNVRESERGLNYLAEGLSVGYYTNEQILQSANEKIRADIQRDIEDEIAAQELFDGIKESLDAKRESAKRVAETATGVYIGSRMADKKRQEETSTKFKWTKYTCSPSCPYKGKGYGPTKCNRDPSTCGHGIGYS